MYYLVASRFKIRGIDVRNAICVLRFMKETDPAEWRPRGGFLTRPGLCTNRTFACGGEEWNGGSQYEFRGHQLS